MNMKLLNLTFLIIAAAFNACAISTNLNDRLRTKIECQDEIDIEKLQKMSKDVDIATYKAIQLKDMSVKQHHVTSVIMVKPLMAKNEADDIAKKLYVPVKPNAVNVAIDWNTSADLLVNALVHETLCIKDLNACNYASMKHAGVNSAAAEVKQLLPCIYQTKHVDASHIAELKTALPQVCQAKRIDVNGISVDVEVVDAALFKVNVNEQTYKVLDSLRSICQYEDRKTCIEGQSPEAQLSDLRKLEIDAYAKWIDIFKTNATCNIQFIKNRRQHQIIGEAWIHRNMYDNRTRTRLQRNLSFFSKRGYDAVLVRFDCTEDMQMLEQMVDDIKCSGLEVYAAYVGKDSWPRWNPFIDPQTLESYVQLVAPKCTGFFLNWRSTSNHAKILPAEYFNYMCSLLRKHNSTIEIYGEVFCGRVDPYKQVTIAYTAPENVTGVVVNNLGFQFSNISYAVSTLFYQIVPQYGKMHKIGQVIGYCPYYKSRRSNDVQLDIEDEYAYKHRIEDKFKKLKCSTMTMSHDGVDDNQTFLVSPSNSNAWRTTDNILYDASFEALASDAQH